MPNDYEDHPIPEVLAQIEHLASEGHSCYVKFTCEACGSRQTSDEANTWHPAGYSCEECNHFTQPTGINFLLVMNIKREKPSDETS